MRKPDMIPSLVVSTKESLYVLVVLSKYYKTGFDNIMKHKCIEQNTPCVHKEIFGNNYYCNLPHKPNHRYIGNGYEIRIDFEHCAEDKGENPQPMRSLKNGQ